MPQLDATALITFLVGTTLVAIFGYIARLAGKATTSVEELNKNMAVVVSKIATHETVLKEHGQDIKDLIRKIGD